VLAYLNRIALVLAPLRRLAWLSTVICLTVFIYAVVGESDTNNNLTRPAMLVGIWSVLLLSFLYGFRAIPEPIAKPWWRRWARKTHRAGYWLLALLTTTATVALLLLCVRLLLYTNTD